MDDYNLSTLIDSKNEWCIRLTNILTPCLIEGVKSVFDEAFKICEENDEDDKYLMTFQNLLNNIPKWSSEIVHTEKERIVVSSACSYLEDLLTCVHITQLKSLTSSRAGLKQKKVNIDIPNIETFIHKAYINIARKVYVNVYLFERDIMPLQVQKNNRELELIVKECVLNTVRENIPVENILKIYLDETQETDVEVEEKREKVPDKEAIARLEKEAMLAKAKKEVKEMKEMKEKDSISTALKDANKKMIQAELEKEREKEREREKEKEKERDSDRESDYESDTTNDGERLVFDDKKRSSRDLDLDIKTLGDDPDKLDLDILDLELDLKATNDEIDLGVMEL